MPPAGDRPFSRSIGVEGPFLLFVGRLASNKGLLELVEAFATLAKHDPTSTLVIVGADGGMRPAVERRIHSLGLGSRIRIPGFVADDRLLASAFREARLFVLPSEYEAFGLVLLEALAQGTPVVASRVGGIPSSSRTARPDDWSPRTTRRRSRRLFSASGTTRRRATGWGRTAATPSSRGISWDRVVDELERIFREVTDGR